MFTHFQTFNDMGYIKQDKPKYGDAIGRVFGHRFDDGGKISQQKIEPKGVTEFNAGGSHEENERGGVPQGIAPDGAPNLVEEGEVKLKDIIGVDNQYILSNRLMVDAEHAKKYGLPDSVVGLTYAAAFKKLFEPLKERSGNAEVKNEIAHLANAFMESQDALKAEQEMRQAGDMMKQIPPEMLAQLMQAQQGGGQGQPVPPQGMPPQGMQGQPGMGQMQGEQPQGMPMGAEQGMPPQGMPPEMMQGQPQPAMGGPGGMPPQMMQGGPQQGMPMMAKGGRLNLFAKGGKLTKQKDNMFNGMFEHSYGGGGDQDTIDKLTNQYNNAWRDYIGIVFQRNGMPMYHGTPSAEQDKAMAELSARKEKIQKELNAAYEQRSHNAMLRGYALNTYLGKYGDGDKRKEVLREYYEPVQSIVNDAITDRNNGMSEQDIRNKHFYGLAYADGGEMETADDYDGASSESDTTYTPENYASGDDDYSEDDYDDYDADGEDDAESADYGSDVPDFESMDDEEIESLIQQLTDIIRRRNGGGRSGDTAEMDEVLSKTEGQQIPNEDY